MLNQESEFNYAGSFRRSFASAIDIIIANIIRMITSTALGVLWFGRQVSNFQKDFKEKFGVEVIGRNIEQVQFFAKHSLFKSALLFCLIVFLSGALYHILLNASSWQATIGKKLTKIIIIKNNGEKLTILESAAHYFLSLVPWIFIFYIMAYQMVNGVNMYNAITGNTFNMLFGLITVFWLQIHLITKKKTTAHDLICKTVMVVRPA